MAGFCRVNNAAYATTAPNASFLGFETYIDGSALIRTTLEGTSGMSGGPVWVEAESLADVANLGGLVHIVGIAIGSPCLNGSPAENWVTMLTLGVLSRIETIMETGAHPGMERYDFSDWCEEVDPASGLVVWCGGSGGGEAPSCPGL